MRFTLVLIGVFVMFADAITELGTIETAVIAIGVAGLLVFVGVRAFHWAKGALG